MERVKSPKENDWDKLVIEGDLEYDYGQVLSDEQQATLHGYVSENQDSINLICQAQARPFVRLPETRYEVSENDYRASSRTLARLLSCAALDAALRGDPGTLDKDIAAGLRLPELLAEGGVILDSLTLWSMCSIGLKSIENVLYYVHPPKHSLSNWLEILGQELYTTLRVQREALKNDTTYTYQGYTFEGPIFDSMDFGYWQATASRAMVEWTQVSYFGQNAYVQLMTATADAAGRDFYETVTWSAKEHVDERWEWNKRNFFPWLFYLDFYRVNIAYVHKIAQAATARTALASLLYLEDHGKMPNQVEDLTPDYLPVPPRDPFTPDGILHYRLTDTQAVFYSIGPNGRDDGVPNRKVRILKAATLSFGACGETSNLKVELHWRLSRWLVEHTLQRASRAHVPAT